MCVASAVYVSSASFFAGDYSASITTLFQLLLVSDYAVEMTNGVSDIDV